MKYVAACVWAILGALAGIYGLLAARRSPEKPNTEADAEASGSELPAATHFSAAAFCETLKSIAAVDRVLIIVSALSIGAIALRLQNAGAPVLTMGRVLVAALLMLCAMMIDRKTHRIPNKLVLAMLGAGVVFLVLEFFWSRDMFRGNLLSCLLGMAAFLVLFYAMARLTHGGIGMGDVKLISAQAWLVGFVITLYATLFSLFACSATAVVLLATKKKTTKDHIAFGPFLFVGYALAMLISNL